MSKSHLVILKKPYVELILSGKKTIESRFMKAYCPPMGQVEAGDKLFLKVSSGPVCATAVVTAVRNFTKLDKSQISDIRRRYDQQILGSNEYWSDKENSTCGVLIWLSDAKAIEPVYIDKKDWRAWVVLRAGADFGLLTKR